MQIPEPLRLWWHDGAGGRVLRYKGRQWTVLALVSLICTPASLTPVESFLGRSMLVVVPYLLGPAAIVAAVLTPRFPAGKPKLTVTVEGSRSVCPFASVDLAALSGLGHV